MCFLLTLLNISNHVCCVQVLGEDLVLVQGQQDRLLRGGDTWNAPVSYDKMGVRYRRWRNSVQVRAIGREPAGSWSCLCAAAG